MSKGLMVTAVYPGSIAEEMEIEVGDRVLAVQEEELHDIIDFQFGISEDEFLLLIEKQNGEQWELEIEKAPEEYLGLEVEMSSEGLKFCRNNCTFCFVAQMPEGLRSTLYHKDDDYRLSLTQGSFITLSNLSEEEMERIISLHLSPLYVSVHAWDPEVRAALMRNPQAGKLSEQLKRFADAGIAIHAQIVVVPDYNDRDVLAETIEQLGGLYPAIQSIAVVPVGLTRYREKLTPLRGFTSAEAREILAEAEVWQRKFLKSTGKHLIYYADEFYVMANQEFPAAAVYDDFPQLENGVGMARKFIGELESVWDLLPRELAVRSIHLVTGTSAQGFFEVLNNRLMERIKGLQITLHPIRNDFFGTSVTVAGLVTAQDIARQLGDLAGQTVLIPRVMLKADEDVFLDDYSIQWLEEQINGRAIPVENNGVAFLEEITGDSLGGGIIE